MRRLRRYSVLAEIAGQPVYVWAILGAALLGAPAARAQDGEPQRLRLGGIQVSGVRTSVTEAWGKLDFRLTNLSGIDRRARVVAFYENRPAAQYSRDVWVPANATIASWLPLGPAPPQASGMARELQLLLHDFSDGKNRLLLPETEERVRGGAAIYRKRESATALVIDADRRPGPAFGELPLPEFPGNDAVALIQKCRSIHELPDSIHLLDEGSLPRWPKAFEGIDHVVLASGRVSEDPAGMQALRQWVEQGGRLWVMLDRVAVEAIAPLLSEALDFRVVGRLSLTEFQLDDSVATPGAVGALRQRLERPVDFVRVLLPPEEAVYHHVRGWPAWFSRKVGRGKILFTTLGPRGWYRPGTERDPSEALRMATALLQVNSAKPPPLEAFEQLLSQEIGYSVVSRRTVVTIRGAFTIGIMGLGMLARRSRKQEWLGCVAPGVALATAAVFLLMGEMARRATEPTVAFAEIIEAVAGTDEAAVQGLLAVYRPDSGALDIGASRGGFFDLDLAGAEDQTRRLVMTDMGAWHWENLALPAGVRFAPFQFTARSASPLTAVARFGPHGIKGTVVAPGVDNLGDGLVSVPGTRNIALRLTPGGAFSAGIADALPVEQFLAGTLLSDRQQQRQEIFRRFLKRSAADSPSNQPVLMAWGDPLEMPFQLTKGAQMVGTALLSIPLHFERTAPGTRVTIPGAFVPARRVLTGNLARPVLESTLASEQHLRFQLPSAVLPLKLARARLVAKINCHARRVTIAADVDGARVELHKTENPLGPIEIDIAQERLLRLDAEGGLHFNLTIGEPLLACARTTLADATPEWTIEYIELEVVGTTDGPA